MYKSNFAVKFKYEAFYTGGRIQHSADGSRIICGCGSEVKVVDVESGTIVKSIGKVEDDDLSSFTAGFDDKVLVTSHRSGLLRQWNTDTGETVRTWKSIHKGPVACMSFDSTTTLLATGGSDSTVKVWDIVKQYCTHNLKGAQGVFSVVEFHPNPERLILFGSANDCHLRVWDLQTSRCIASMEGHYSTITSLSFTEDGSKLLTGGRDNVVMLWDAVAYRSLKTFPVHETIEGILMLPTSQQFPLLNVNGADLHFITAGSKGVLRVWRASTGTAVYNQSEAVMESQSKGEALSVAIAELCYIPQKNVVVVATHEHNILFYSLQDLRISKQLVGYNDEILDLQFMGKNDTHIAVATNSLYIKVFDLSSFACHLLKGHTDIVLALSVFASNPFMLASSSKDNTIRLWLMNALQDLIQCVAVAAGHTQPVGGLATSRLCTDFVVSGGQDTTMKLWEIPRNVGQAVAFSLRTRFTEIAHEKDINAIAVSPNDQLIATGSQDKTAKLWHASKGQLLGCLRGHKRGIWAVEFSPVDQVLATTSADATIKIWNIADFTCIKAFEGHDSSVLKVAFIAKGMQLVTSASDGLIKLWTIKTNECVKTLDVHSDKVWGLVVNEAEDTLVTGGADSTIVVWKDVTVEEKEEDSKKLEDLILQEQQLLNLLQAKNYVKALGLAITLEQPYRALSILKELNLQPDGKTMLEETILKLREDQIHTLLKFSCVWNTNSKNCFEAQSVLHCILKRFTPQEILQFPDIKSTIESLMPYTERHAARLDTLVQQATFLDFTWKCMKLEDEVS